MSAKDAAFLFGISALKWGVMVRKEGAKPVKDAAVEMLARIIDEDPDAFPLPKIPNSEVVYQTLNKYEEADKKRFSIFVAREGTSGHRWLKNVDTKIGSRVAPILSRLLYIFYNKVLLAGEGSQTEVEKNLKEWKRKIETVASARGLKDPFKTGKWHMQTAAPKKNERKASVAKRQVRTTTVATSDAKPIKRRTRSPNAGK